MLVFGLTLVVFTSFMAAVGATQLVQRRAGRRRQPPAHMLPSASGQPVAVGVPIDATGRGGHR